MFSFQFTFDRTMSFYKVNKTPNYYYQIYTSLHTKKLRNSVFWQIHMEGIAGGPVNKLRILSSKLSTVEYHFYSLNPENFTQDIRFASCEYVFLRIPDLFCGNIIWHFLTKKSPLKSFEFINAAASAVSCEA